MSPFQSPQPRFRLYRPPGTWAEVAGAALTRRMNRSKRTPDDVAALESLVADWMSTEHAVCLSQGRTALWLALRTLIEPGQHVILSPFTYHEVVNVVLCAGGRPLFADVEPDGCNIDARAVERLLDSSPEPVGAVIATHLFGLSCDIERIAAVCAARGVPLIEDAAQCFGARIGGRHIGTFGTAGIFSFNRVKNVSSLWGGMLVTRDEALAERVHTEVRAFAYESRARLLGQALQCAAFDLATARPIFPLLTYPLVRLDALAGTGIAGRFGEAGPHKTAYDRMRPRNLKRMTPFQARLVMRQLEHVDTHAKARVERAAAYHDGLAAIPGIDVPQFHDDGSDIWLSYPVQVPDRAGLLKHLFRCGRDVRTQQYANAADLACFAEFARDCPNARAAAERTVQLPVYPRYALSEVAKNVRAIREYYEGKG